LLAFCFLSCARVPPSPGFFCFLNASAIFAAACGTFFPVLTEMTERRSLSVAVLTGLRMAFLLVIAGEFFAANTGLGYLMLRATGTYNMPSLLAPILAAGIIGLLLEGLTRLIINRLLRA
jgi:hypothetical protein